MCLDTIQEDEILRDKNKHVDYLNKISHFYADRSEKIVNYFKRNPFYLKEINKDFYIYSGEVEFMNLKQVPWNREIEQKMKSFIDLKRKKIIFSNNYGIVTDFNKKFHYLVYLYMLGMTIDTMPQIAKKFITLRDNIS